MTDGQRDLLPALPEGRTCRQDQMAMVLRALTHRISADIPVVLPVHEGPHLSRMQETCLEEVRCQATSNITGSA